MHTSRNAWLTGALLLGVLVVLLCLVPKPENDLFFELRTGTDILHTGRLPHADTYSWSNRGTRWVVPEWGAFVLYTLAFRVGGFFGTWALMAGLTVAAAGLAWADLARRVGPGAAWTLTLLMLPALSPCLQERPYAFTYPLLVIGLQILGRGRRGRPRQLLWLVPLCALWTNLHQGVVAFALLILAYAVGDGWTALWLRLQEARMEPPDLLTEAGRTWKPGDGTGWPRHARQAKRMLGAALLCAASALVSPYGWRVFWNVWITLRDRTLMTNVTEWNPLWTLPDGQWEGLLVIAALTGGALALSRRRRFSDVVILAALAGESVLHARNVPLFALGSLVIGAPHFASAIREARRRLGLPRRAAPRRALALGFAVVCVLAVTAGSFTALRPAVGSRGWSLAGIGEAVARVPSYPADACAFMERENFPAHLRLLNNFEIGGYLLWRLPQEPDFIDGRLDVFVGKTFNDNLTLTRAPASPAGKALLRHYDFDCVITTSAHQAQAFLSDPQWQIVYADPPRARQHCRVFLRRRPQFAGLIARCLKSSSPLPYGGGTSRVQGAEANSQ